MQTIRLLLESQLGAMWAHKVIKTLYVLSRGMCLGKIND